MGCSMQQKRLIVLELFLCLIFCLHYFFIDVERCICSVCIIGAFISFLVMKLYSPQFSSGWVCRIFWILALGVSKSILIPGLKLRVWLLLQCSCFLGCVGSFYQLAFACLLAVIICNAVKIYSFLCFSDLNCWSDLTTF